MDDNTMPMHCIRRSDEGGFTLVELLIAVVVAGVLTAVAVIGVIGINSKGATSACKASRDSATAATFSFYSVFGHYPQTFGDLTSPPSGTQLMDASGLTVQSPTKIAGNGGWTITMQPGPTTADRTTFSNC